MRHCCYCFNVNWFNKSRTNTHRARAWDRQRQRDRESFTHILLLCTILFQHWVSLIPWLPENSLPFLWPWSLLMVKQVPIFPQWSHYHSQYRFSLYFAQLNFERWNKLLADCLTRKLWHWVILTFWFEFFHIGKCSWWVSSGEDRSYILPLSPQFSSNNTSPFCCLPIFSTGL